MPQLVDAAKRGVMLSGGLPMVFPTISIHESFASPTSMYLRNLMAMETEEMIRAQPMDAVVLIGGCDKTLPAQIMAAVSSEVPAIFLPTGPMATGSHRGERLGACTDCRRFWGRFRAGEIDQDEILEINDRLVSSVGTCTVMGTASTMACLTEAMGLCLPMAGSAPATSAERVRLAEATGRAAAGAPEAAAPTVREILTPGAFRNGLAVLQALGGSTNGVVHLAAIAGRWVDGSTWPSSTRSVKRCRSWSTSSHPAALTWPNFTRPAACRGSSPRSPTPSTVRSHGRRRYDRRGSSTAYRPATRTASSARRSDPVVPVGAIAVLTGNLAPRGAVIKHSAASPELHAARGPGCRLRLGRRHGAPDR